jgi:hypothetical protein
MGLQFPTPVCVVCKKTVEDIECVCHSFTGDRTITVRCHGESHMFTISEYEYANFFRGEFPCESMSMQKK